MGSKRGQIWTTDFTAGVAVLVFILLFFTLLWNTLAIRWNAANEYRQMETDALLASDSLMTTSGEPKSWETLPQIGNISALGLVNGRDELNTAKIEKLVSLNSSAYTAIKERLGLQRYELGIRITDLKKSATYYEFGQFSGGLSNSVVYERLGIMDKSPVIVHMEVWK